MCKEMEKIRDKGMAEGMAKGESKYAEKLSKLQKILTESGKIDDLLKAVADSAYAKTLFQQFGI